MVDKLVKEKQDEIELRDFCIDELHQADVDKAEKEHAVTTLEAKIEDLTQQRQAALDQIEALNGDIFDPEVDGLDGVVEAYKNALKNVNLYGPTNFAPIIELVNDMAEAENVDQAN